MTERILKERTIKTLQEMNATRKGRSINWDLVFASHEELRRRLEMADARLARIRDLLRSDWSEGGLMHGDEEHRANLLARLVEIFK